MPDAVVDIGNSRIKFCRVANHKLTLPVRAVAADDLAGWERIATEWNLGSGKSWAVASTDAARRDQFVAWVQSRGETAIVIDAPRQVPIGVSLDEPDRVGVDRLLNALAVKAIYPAGQPAVIVSAGTAVTVDLLHEQGSFAWDPLESTCRHASLSIL